MKKRGFDPQAKAKKQKKIAIGGAVLLVALLAFQGPRTLKQLNAKAPEAAPTPAATASPAAGGGSAAGGASLASAETAGGTQLPRNPDPAPLAKDGQLVSFNLFKSKDPFAQQLSTSSSTESGSEPPATSPPSSPPASSPPTTTPPVTTPPVTTPPVTTPPATTPPVTKPPTSTPPPTPTPTPSEPPAAEPSPSDPPVQAAPTSATISVNGVSEKVAVDAVFPKASPLFRLVAITNGVAKIAVADGSLQDGAKSVPLEKGKTLTLMNTADGTRYVLRLVSVS